MKGFAPTAARPTWYDTLSPTPYPGAAVTDTDPAVEPEAPTRELVAAWEDLRRQFPPPTWADVVPEWKWVHGRMADGTLDPKGRYAGLWVVVYNQEVIASGPDPLRLQVDKARELGLHPERLVATYVAGEWPGPRW